MTFAERCVHCEHNPCCFCGRVEVITRYEAGAETTYSIDGGKAYITKKELTDE